MKSPNYQSRRAAPDRGPPRRQQGVDDRNVTRTCMSALAPWRHGTEEWSEDAGRLLFAFQRPLVHSLGLGQLALIRVEGARVVDRRELDGSCLDGQIIIIKRINNVL